MFRSTIFAAILLAVGLCVPASAEGSFLGSVKVVQGAASVLRDSGSLPVTEGLRLMPQDVIKTGADGRLSFILHDGTRVSLGPNSEMKLSQFAYEPAQSNYGLVIDMAKGVLAYVSGKIAKFSPESVKVRTPTGVIGVRGTKFAVLIDDPRGVQ